MFRPPEDVVAFWFGGTEPEMLDRPRAEWFTADPGLASGAAGFRAEFDAAVQGHLSSWAESSTGALALILLLDQFSLLLERGSPGAFAADPLARRVARLAIERGFDAAFPETARWFFYLPFEHSEDPDDQAFAVQLFGALSPTPANLNALDYAVRHQRVIARFGRFPNRNAALGRESTPEELEFLAGPEAPF